MQLRNPTALAMLASASLLMACFGDNTDEEGQLPDGAPSILDIAGPEAIDAGDGLDLTVTIKGKANEQLSVAIDATLGSFTPQNKVIITDDNGDGVFATRYTNGGKAGLDTITANVSSLSTAGKSLTKALTIFEVERLGNVTPIETTLAETANYLIVYPFELPAPRTLRKVAIVAPQAATTQIGVYSSSAGDDMTAKPVDALVRVTANLVVGANEISVPSMDLAAGRYWMAVTYSGTPLVRKVAPPVGTTLYGWRITPYTFSSGLPDKLDTLVFSTPLSLRNFYLVLRK
jgi:hypothetical protein